MKKFLSILMISLLAGAMLFTACKKDETNNNNNSETPGGGGTEAQPTGTIENNVVTDIDGNVYNGVWLNGKLWMKENLRTTRYADGSAIPVAASVETTSPTEPYRYAPNNDESNVSSYGWLYNWPATVHGASSGVVQGACPNGWHVPSTGEWEDMTEHLIQQEEYLCNGGLAQAMCNTWAWEPMDFPHACLPGTDLMSNNATGFSALPAGAVTDNPNMLPLGYNAMFWCATSGGEEIAWSRSISYTYYHIGSSAGDYKGNGYSVRCVRN